jgi:MFS family permease
MRPLEWFRGLSKPKKILFALLAIPAFGLSGWVLGLFGLPLIGYAVSRNSWRAGKRTGDNKVFITFAVLVLAAISIFVLARQPQFRTDWEGGNPLDDLIMLMMLVWVTALATAWGFAGWVAHRLVMISRERRNREIQNRVAAPD